MKKLFLGVFAGLFLFSALGAAQSVTVTSGGNLVTVSAGDSKCIFQGPGPSDSSTVTCFRGTSEVLFLKVHPGVGLSAIGGYSFPKYVVGWTLLQPTPNTFTWQATVDGATVGAGTF